MPSFGIDPLFQATNGQTFFFLNKQMMREMKWLTCQLFHFSLSLVLARLNWQKSCFISCNVCVWHNYPFVVWKEDSLLQWRFAQSFVLLQLNVFHSAFCVFWFPFWASVEISVTCSWFFFLFFLSPCIYPCSWIVSVQKLKTHLWRTQSSKLLLLEPWGGQNMAMHATSAARDFFLKLIATLTVHSPAFFSPSFSCVGCGYHWLLYVLAGWNRSPCSSL